MKHFFQLVKKCSRRTVSLLVVVSFISILVSSVVSLTLTNFHNLTIPSVGNLKTLGVESYFDLDAKNKTEKINWGTVWVGSSNDVILYVQSISNYDVVLSMESTDWAPEKASDYLKLVWDYDGSVLSPGETIMVTLTLSAELSGTSLRDLVSSGVTNFHFDIHMLASQI